jgi:hypothetical protein
MTPNAPADVTSESLIALPPEQFGSLLPFVPDTPWTTTTIHVLQRKQGKVFVDSPTGPRNLVVVASGDPATRTLDRAYLFGAATADALKSYVAGIKAPTELVCDEDVAELVREHHPEARSRDAVVHWFERVEEAQAVQVEPGAKRLRISDAESIAQLVPGASLRTFRTVRDLVTGGSAFVAEEDGQVVSAAYAVDQSVKFERISCTTREASRQKGLATLVARRLLKCVSDQARVPCMVVDRNNVAGQKLADKLGFTQRAQMRTFVTRLKAL